MIYVTPVLVYPSCLANHIDHGKPQTHNFIYARKIKCFSRSCHRTRWQLHNFHLIMCSRKRQPENCSALPVFTQLICPLSLSSPPSSKILYPNSHRVKMTQSQRHYLNKQSYHIRQIAVAKNVYINEQKLTSYYNKHLY